MEYFANSRQTYGCKNYCLYCEYITEMFDLKADPL